MEEKYRYTTKRLLQYIQCIQRVQSIVYYVVRFFVYSDFTQMKKSSNMVR